MSCERDTFTFDVLGFQWLLDVFFLLFLLSHLQLAVSYIILWSYELYLCAGCIQVYWFVWRVAKAMRLGRNVKYVLAQALQVVVMCLSVRSWGFDLSINRTTLHVLQCSPNVTSASVFCLFIAASSRGPPVTAAPLALLVEAIVRDLVQRRW